MKKNNVDSLEYSSLRQKAEDKIKNQKSVKPELLKEADTMKLLHELDVHQIELEMQNEELQAARDKAKDASEKFAAIYDFAYTGYLTLSRDCKIQELNLSCSGMLGIERSNLINKDFKQFVTVDTLSGFNEFFRKVFVSKNKETSEVKLKVKGKLSIFAHIEANLTEDEQFCLLTIVDISKRARAEEALKLKTDQFEQFNYLLIYNEQQIVELKKEVNLLLKKLGEKEKFVIEE